MKIDFANLQKQYKVYKEEIDYKIHTVLNKGNYILGDEVLDLEANLEKFTGSANCISCSNGTDALILALMAIDIKPGDEVITTPYTYIATSETIAFLKAVPVFADVNKDTFNINESSLGSLISNKTKAIMPVSLFGQPPEMDTILEIAKNNSLKVILDGAQSFGSTYKGVSDSALGDISTTSFFPAKPLGCYGDGGAVFTNNDEYAEKIKQLRVHGQEKKYVHKYIGIGGRLDTIQAAVLLAKIPHYKEELKERQRVSERYSKNLRDLPGLVTPTINEGNTSAWAQYSLFAEDRDNLVKKLSKNSIPTAIYYPIPLHMQECFSYLGYKKGDFPVSELLSESLLSLPMNPFLSNDEIDYICENIINS